MKLIPHWRRVLTRAWSVRLVILAGLLSGGEVVLQIFGESLPLSDIARAGLYFVVTTLALILRFVAQPGVTSPKE